VTIEGAVGPAAVRLSLVVGLRASPAGIRPAHYADGLIPPIRQNLVC
jgi:hypothetical protein